MLCIYFVFTYAISEVTWTVAHNGLHVSSSPSHLLTILKHSTQHLICSISSPGRIPGPSRRAWGMLGRSIGKEGERWH